MKHPVIPPTHNEEKLYEALDEAAKRLAKCQSPFCANRVYKWFHINIRALMDQNRNEYSEIRNMIADSIKPHQHSAVFLSGGIDSTILLKHLSEKTETPITAIHIRLPGETEYLHAREIAEYYGCDYHEVTAINILKTFSEIAPLLDAPRFNLWPIYGYRKAKELGIKNIYTAEGLDEHFGGYIDKPRVSYQEYWGGVLEWSIPTHRQLATLCGIKLHTPFLTLPIIETIKYWMDPHDSPRDKHVLRQAYQGIIPDDVVNRRKYAGRINWENVEIWDTEIKPYLHTDAPSTHQEANKEINKWITRRWLDDNMSRM